MPGFLNLSYEVEVDTAADDATLADIKAASEKGSPMFDNILNSTPVTGKVTRAG